MLNALDNQLRLLAQDYYPKFRENIKERAGGHVNEEQLGALKEFIFLMPITLKQLSIYWNRKDTPAEAKRVSGFIITYIYHPRDLLPEGKNNLFGYLDDAYLVVQAYLKIHDHFLKDWRQLPPEDLELTSRARKLIVAPQMLIPEVAGKIDKMIETLINGDQSEFLSFVNNHS
ncbi:MAG TPA: hypothetical protein DCZ43_03795 [candidate division Zixibacteria bacterium]|nr:hypothetical protein [candidate division Zixibacteria bacterium]